MKKLLLLLLCVPLMFSCGEKKEEKKEKDNTEQSDNTENQINTVKIFDSVNIEGECNLSKYFIYLVNELNNLAENSNEENVNSLGLKSKRRAKSLINEMLNAADWGRQNELDISTMKKCKEFIENESLLNDELLEEFYKEMYNDLIDERVDKMVKDGQIKIVSEKLTEDEIERVYIKMKANGHKDEEIKEVLDYLKKDKVYKNKKNLKQHKVNFNPYLWSYE